jgi:tRNA(fMet)-specific endonuclease VapC
MSGKRFLDTNIVIALLGGDVQVQQRLDAVPEILVSLVVLGELFYGAAHSARPQQNTAEVEGFARTCTVVQLDMETARIYGLIKAELRRKGRPIPENDLWIAASARQHDLVLVTRDPHFERVETLAIENWR